MRKRGMGGVDVTTNSMLYVQSTELVNRYLRDIRGFEVISPFKERELFKRIKEGDQSAVAEIMEANQRFVYAVAKKFGQGDNIMDLVQEGNLGMMEAIERYDPKKRTADGTPIRFLSFAVWYIRRNICMYILNNDLIRKTNNTKLTLRANKLRDEFIAKNQRIPTAEELSEAIYREYGIRVKDLSYLYEIDAKRLGANVCEGSDSRTVEESIAYNMKSASQNEFVREENKEYNRELIGAALKVVSPRDAKVMKMLYGIDCDKEYTLEEVAAKVGLTRERVRQIKNRTLRRMKRYVDTCPQL